jgi:hypothetical protein
MWHEIMMMVDLAVQAPVSLQALLPLHGSELPTSTRSLLLKHEISR